MAMQDSSQPRRIWLALEGPHELAGYAPPALFGVTLFGVLFSLYLTILEPFVIRAVCAWCLISAFLVTLLMLLSLRPALQAIEVRQD